MASRPFATINVALETDEEPPDLIGGNVKVSTTFSPSRDPSAFFSVRDDRAATRRSFIHHPHRPSSSLKWELSLVPVNLQFVITVTPQ